MAEVTSKKTKLSNLIGFWAGFFATISFAPQVILIWSMRPEPATSISLPMYVLFCLGVAGWLVFGILIKSWPVIIWNSATLFLASSVLLYKLAYG